MFDIHHNLSDLKLDVLTLDKKITPSLAKKLLSHFNSLIKGQQDIHEKKYIPRKVKFFYSFKDGKKIFKSRKFPLMCQFIKQNKAKGNVIENNNPIASIHNFGGIIKTKKTTYKMLKRESLGVSKIQQELIINELYNIINHNMEKI